MYVVEILEAAMLVAFGVSWPVAIAKTLKVRKVHGKSLGFLILVFSGYLCGIAAKLLQAWLGGHLPSWVTMLYTLNALLVGTEIVLYYRFREPPETPALDLEPESPGTEMSGPNKGSGA